MGIDVTTEKRFEADIEASFLSSEGPGKVDTFILDFANKKEDILDAFQPFYQETSCVIGKTVIKYGKNIVINSQNTNISDHFFKYF